VVQKKLWEVSDNTIQALEKEGAMRRAKESRKERKRKHRVSCEMVYLLRRIRME
jgi:hypothetical protein